MKIFTLQDSAVMVWRLRRWWLCVSITFRNFWSSNLLFTEKQFTSNIEKKTKDYRNVDPASIENEHTQSCKEMQEEKKLEDERTVSMEIVLYIVVCLFNIRRAHSMGSNKI